MRQSEQPMQDPHPSESLCCRDQCSNGQNCSALSLCAMFGPVYDVDESDHYDLGTHDWLCEWLVYGAFPPTFPWEPSLSLCHEYLLCRVVSGSSLHLLGLQPVASGTVEKSSLAGVASLSKPGLRVIALERGRRTVQTSRSRPLLHRPVVGFVPERADGALGLLAQSFSLRSSP